MDIIQTLARELGESAQHVENVVRLLDEGNTIPFIARYGADCSSSWNTLGASMLDFMTFAILSQRWLWKTAWM